MAMYRMQLVESLNIQHTTQYLRVCALLGDLIATQGHHTPRWGACPASKRVDDYGDEEETRRFV